MALQKADELLQESVDPSGLNRDEIAAVNLFTQDILYRELNGALRSEEPARVQVRYSSAMSDAAVRDRLTPARSN
jgi:hypothetical protein